MVVTTAAKTFSILCSRSPRNNTPLATASIDTPWNMPVAVPTGPSRRAVTKANIVTILNIEAGKLWRTTLWNAAFNLIKGFFIKSGKSMTDGREKANNTIGSEAKLPVTLTIILERAVMRLAIKAKLIDRSTVSERGWATIIAPITTSTIPSHCVSVRISPKTKKARIGT